MYHQKSQDKTRKDNAKYFLLIVMQEKIKTTSVRLVVCILPALRRLPCVGEKLKLLCLVAFLVFNVGSDGKFIDANR